MNSVTIINRAARPFLAGVVGLIVAATVAILVVGGSATAAPSASRPNIVFIQTDDQTLCSVLDDPLCPKGARQVMDFTGGQFASESTTFRNYYATHPRCCPSRASYLTGLYSHNHNVVSNKHGYEAFKFHDKALPVWLDNAGYATAHIGKYLNGYFGRFADERPVPKGWDEWFATVDDGTYKMFGYTMMLKTPVPVPIRNREGAVLTTTTPTPQRFQFGIADTDYQTDVETQIALDFIDRQATASEPFFLAINPLAPHNEHIGKDLPNPRPAPRDRGAFSREPLPKGTAFNEKDVSDKPEFIQRKDRFDGDDERFILRRYRDRLASLLAVDDMVKAVYDELAATGQLENTVIFFTSDNGFMQGEHRLRAGKVALYDEDVRVPMIVRGPGFPAAEERLQPVGNIDIAPTMAELAGATPLIEPDGTSMLPFARDAALDTNRTIVLENGDDGSAGIRTKRYTYIKHEKGMELYDNLTDPFQLESIHASKKQATLVDELKAQLKVFRKCRAEQCRS